MTRKAFDRGLKLLAATWPDRGATAETAAAYWLALNDLHDSVFEAAIAACLRECTFYPKPAEILAKSEAILTDSGVLPKLPEAAWEELLETVRGPRQYYVADDGWGFRYDHEFSSEAVAEACDAIGGLRQVATTAREELPFLRKRFLDHYEPRRRRVVAYDRRLLSEPLPTVRQLVSPEVVKPCVCGHPTNCHAAIWNTGRRGKCDVPGCGCTKYERPEAAKEDAV